MTLHRCIELLKELKALERVSLAIASHGFDGDWEAALRILSDRCYWMRAALQVEDPALVKQAADVLRDEVVSSATTTIRIVDVPPTITIH